MNRYETATAESALKFLGAKLLQVQVAYKEGEPTVKASFDLGNVQPSELGRLYTFGELAMIQVLVLPMQATMQQTKDQREGVQESLDAIAKKAPKTIDAKPAKPVAKSEPVTTQVMHGDTTITITGHGEIAEKLAMDLRPTKMDGWDDLGKCGWWLVDSLKDDGGRVEAFCAIDAGHVDTHVWQTPKPRMQRLEAKSA